jgi:hypothetical protein
VEREMEFLRQQIEYMHRMLETCMARIGSLEAQVAELERRPVAITVPEEPEKRARGLARPVEEDLLMVGEVSFWETRGWRKG